MSDCANHKKDIAGIDNMKVLAEMIGDLHYETLTDLFGWLHAKIRKDGMKDLVAGREMIGNSLLKAADLLNNVRYFINEAWEISKPFMTNKDHENTSHDR